MSNAWNLSFIRKIAGLPAAEPKKPLVESIDDIDDNDEEDRDVAIASKDKRQEAFEKRNKKELSSAEKEAAALKKSKPTAKKDDVKKVEPKKEVAKPAAAPKEEPKKIEAKAAEAKKDDAPAEKKEVDDKAPSTAEKSAETKKRGRTETTDIKKRPAYARKWLADNAGHTRGVFIKHMSNHPDADIKMSAHHANTFYYAQKKKNAAGGPMKEAFVIYHPYLANFMLAENREMNTMQWIDPSSPLEPFILETEVEAEKIAKYMREWKNQQAQVVKVSFED